MLNWLRTSFLLLIFCITSSYLGAQAYALPQVFDVPNNPYYKGYSYLQLNNKFTTKKRCCIDVSHNYLGNKNLLAGYFRITDTSEYYYDNSCLLHGTGGGNNYGSKYVQFQWPINFYGFTSLQYFNIDTNNHFFISKVEHFKQKEKFRSSLFEVRIQNSHFFQAKSGNFLTGWNTPIHFFRANDTFYHRVCLEADSFYLQHHIYLKPNGQYGLIVMTSKLRFWFYDIVGKTPVYVKDTVISTGFPDTCSYKMFLSRSTKKLGLILSTYNSLKRDTLKNRHEEV